LTVFVAQAGLQAADAPRWDPTLGDDGMSPNNWHPQGYKAPALKGATLHEGVRFLDDWRSWERIDVYVPESGEAKKPCIILFYGGGWGGKVGSGVIKEWGQACVDAGYVVAVPDYTLCSQDPVPTAIWDGAAAVRWLRAHAADYRIDPERMGAQGFSAGGWLAQWLAPADSAALTAVRSHFGKAQPGDCFPLLNPHPTVAADQALRLQAFASDWGAGVIAEHPPMEPDDKRLTGLGIWRSRGIVFENLERSILTADDPVMLTCHNGERDAIAGSVRRMQALGIPSESVWLDAPKGLHVPGPQTASVNADGSAATWLTQHISFFDRLVKNPTQSTAPEAYPAGLPIASPTAVTLRSVHPDGAIHYTLDPSSSPGGDSAAASGSGDWKSWPVYRGPVTVAPDQTLKAIAIKPGLTPSRVLTCTYPKVSVAPPVIEPVGPSFEIKVGEPFKLQMKASGEGVKWAIAGRIVGQILEAYDPNVDSTKRKAMPPWLTIDAATGLLSGMPAQPGVNIVLVSAAITTPEKRIVLDTRRIGIVVRQGADGQKH
jgi:hypothetical protein